MQKLVPLIAFTLIVGWGSSVSAQVPAVLLDANGINAANLLTDLAIDDRPYIFSPEPALPVEDGASVTPLLPSAAIVRTQILLDQFGASPGVIDGYDGENVRKAVMAFQAMAGMQATGTLDAQTVGLLETGLPVMAAYVITAEDLSEITGPTPVDYAEKAQMGFLGYASVAEKLSERFHMDVDFLRVLNPGATFTAGETIAVAVTGAGRTGLVARIEADKMLRQVRAYDAQGMLLAAYPATIGSEDNPSPSGSYVVEVVAPMPNYTYNPRINFQQGENTEVLTIPPGPNGPVGSMWIALSKPTYGIHGTPEPARIDKTGSHGCVRLTNWDAEELGAMVSPGVVVDFL
ncbi:L,D-transpeptidase family protein [Devosia sp. SL43]|uniref:L,D-transpeptidase family protein n=1 Tax=Devosia sp. SL43 TaxID=2806348 RepID=UPI001F36689B|nr:L,D-transpeptidase family protein [Devosia sp. SL43]UJW84084.1 murein L,D-transpeptidase [Devosia sp. SL43]